MVLTNEFYLEWFCYIFHTHFNKGVSEQLLISTNIESNQKQVPLATPPCIQ